MSLHTVCTAVPVVSTTGLFIVCLSLVKQGGCAFTVAHCSLAWG